MVTRNYKLHFEFTDETYEKYKNWCKQNHLDGYCGAIGGSHWFEILPTSIGECISAVAERPVLDENGEPSYDKNGNLKTKRVECVLEDF